MRIAGLSGLRVGAVALAVTLAACFPAAAEWRVVGPGIAVGEAREGPASLALECGDGLVLAAYGYGRAPGGSAVLSLSVDGGEGFELTAGGSARRLVLGPPEDGLMEQLSTGREATLSGGLLTGVPEQQRRFGLAGSAEALATVARGCARD